MALALKSTGLKIKKEIVEKGLKTLLNINNHAKLKPLGRKLNGNIKKMRVN